MKKSTSILTLVIIFLCLASSPSNAQTQYRTLSINIEGEGLIWSNNGKTNIEVTVSEGSVLDMEFTTKNQSDSYTFVYDLKEISGATCDWDVTRSAYLQGPSGYSSEYLSFKDFHPSNIITVRFNRNLYSEWSIQWWETTPANPDFEWPKEVWP